MDVEKDYEQVHRLIRQRGWTVATAESCTGGMIGDTLTNAAGCSAWFLGGILAYSNTAKTTLLGLDPHLLQTEGAVSEAAAQAMASGVRRCFGSDVGISATGIAGPSGGEEGKPVGLVYIGLAWPGGLRAERHVWPHDRIGNKAATTQRALQMIIDLLS